MYDLEKRVLLAREAIKMQNAERKGQAVTVQRSGHRFERDVIAKHVAVLQRGISRLDLQRFQTTKHSCKLA